MRISDWSSDVCSSDLQIAAISGVRIGQARAHTKIARRHHRGFQLETLGPHAPAHIVGRAPARRRRGGIIVGRACDLALIAAGPPQIARAAVDSLDDADAYVEGLALAIPRARTAEGPKAESRSGR